MANLLNYKYEIFPTRPQRAQLYTILRQTKLQWNRAVTIRKKLLDALKAKQFEYIIQTLLSEDKDNNQGQRRKAIAKLAQNFPDLEPEKAHTLYDVKNLLGNLFDDFGPQYTDIPYLADTLKNLYTKQFEERKRDISEGKPLSKHAKLTVYWRLRDAIGQYAGYAAKKYMDQSFNSPKTLTLSTIRANISGYTNSHKWNRAIKPSPEQRRYGAKGEPNYKRRGESITYQVQNKSITDLIRPKRRNKGYQAYVNSLHKGSEWVDMAYHRVIPEGSNIKQINVTERTGHFFIVFSIEVPEHVWKIEPLQAGWHAGIDPGAHIPLAVAIKDVDTEEFEYLAVEYEFINKSLDKLEELQQRLSRKQGPKRKRATDEIEYELNQFSQKASIRKLTSEQREKEIAKKKARLETTMIRQSPSKAWLELNNQIRDLHYRIANQRRDVLHKISRVLTEGCDLVGIGHWEPEREVSYRKQKRLLEKKVKRGIEGAQKELDALVKSKSKQGAKGSKARRREGRDRSIATLRAMCSEKAKRSGTAVYTHLNEAGTTMCCSICGKPTGPRGDTSVREWTCEVCNTTHHRDMNSAVNILNKTEEEFAAAQAAALETEQSAIRTEAHGPMKQPGGSSSRFHGRGFHGRGGHHIVDVTSDVGPFLLGKEAPKSFKSLIEMGIITTLSTEDKLLHAQKPH